MAKILTAPGVDAISGNLGSINFANTRNGTIARKRPSKVNHKTEAQINHRAAFADSFHNFTTLTPDQRNAWSAAALTAPFSNRLGLPRFMSSAQLYIAANIIRPTSPFNPTYYPTSPTRSSQPFDLVLTASATGPNISLAWDANNRGLSFALVLSIARPMKTHSVFISHWRFAVAARHIIPNPFPLASYFTAIFGSPLEGEFISATARAWNSAKLPSLPVQTSCFVSP